MSDIVLSSSVRSNLLNLQRTSDLIATTQNRLATGRKVNSALDNPTNFFTASSLNSRANDLSNLLDGLSNGIKTIEAADNGLKAITKTVETLQSTVRQARQDKSFRTETYSLNAGATGNLSFSGGAVGSTPVDVALTTGATAAATAGTSTFTFAAANFQSADDTISFDIAVDGGAATTVTIDQTIANANSVGNDGNLDTIAEFQAALDAALTAAGVTGVTAANDGTDVTFTSATTGATSSVAISALASAGTTDPGTAGLAGVTATAGTDATTETVKSVDALVTEINADTTLNGKVRAANVNGQLRIENISTSDLTLTGVGTGGSIDGGTGTSDIGGNSTRNNLVSQFNELRSQLDRLADDSGFNGINLLRGDRLRLSFNETGTSSIDIQAKDADGNVRAITSEDLGISAATAAGFESDDSLDAILDDLGAALGELRTQASAFGANLSSVQNRQDFTKSTINTLRTGADSLTLADINEEAANLLSLQTRQQLSNTALSLSAQADQGVLRLF